MTEFQGAVVNIQLAAMTIISVLHPVCRREDSMTDIKPDLTVTDLPSYTPDNPLEALSWLGDTVEEVAEGLRARGIKGRPKQPKFCPVARYLSIWYDGWVSVGPTSFDAQRLSQKDIGENQPLTPKPITQFIYAFDSGQFPDLIAL